MPGAVSLECLVATVVFSALGGLEAMFGVGLSASVSATASYEGHARAEPGADGAAGEDEGSSGSCENGAEGEKSRAPAPPPAPKPLALGPPPDAVDPGGGATGRREYQYYYGYYYADAAAGAALPPSPKVGPPPAGKGVAPPAKGAGGGAKPKPKAKPAAPPKAKGKGKSAATKAKAKADGKPAPAPRADERVGDRSSPTAEPVPAPAGPRGGGGGDPPPPPKGPPPETGPEDGDPEDDEALEGLDLINHWVEAALKWLGERVGYALGALAHQLLAFLLNLIDAMGFYLFGDYWRKPKSGWP